MAPVWCTSETIQATHASDTYNLGLKMQDSIGGPFVIDTVRNCQGEVQLSHKPVDFARGAMVQGMPDPDTGWQLATRLRPRCHL